MYSPPAILKPILFVPGIIYESLMRLRNAAYSTGVFRPKRLPAPVISIGNMTLGGAGKTPLAIHVAEILVKLGHATALLSRGYGRCSSSQARLLTPQTKVPDPVSVLGDEPALIRHKLPGLWMGIAGDRYSIGRQIAALQPAVTLILDDGFQHRKLYRDIDLVVLDPTQPLTTNSVFPRGSLREPLEEIKRSQIVLINTIYHTDKCTDVEQLVRSLHPGAKIFHCVQKIDMLIPFPNWKNAMGGAIEKPPGKSAFLAAAIGNPGRFCRDVDEFGIEVKGSRFFRDHHVISPNEWLQCACRARDIKASFILTTEKDAIKIPHIPELPLFVARQSTSIVEADEFESILKLVVERTQGITAKSEAPTPML